MDADADVLVIGAGPGGSSAAFHLARAGLKVLLVDRAVFPRDKVCGDGLTPRALAALAELDLLDDVRRLGQPVHGLDIHAPNGRAIAAPFPALGELPAYALTVPRLFLDDVVRARAEAAGAAFQSPVHVDGLAFGAERVVAHGERDGRPCRYTARMAVIAVGASARLLARSGVLRRPPAVLVAARAYVDGSQVAPDALHLHLADVPLPGYGWVFPLAGGAANVGLGFPARRAGRPAAESPRAAFARLVRSAPVRRQLGADVPLDGLRGHAIRTDFHVSPLVAPRTVLVGEAAGLVNPLSGDGIDYALESGKLAAEHMTGLFARGAFDQADVAGYGRLLRRRYGPQFRLFRRLWQLSASRRAVDALIHAAERRPDLRAGLLRLVFGPPEWSAALTASRLARAVAGGGPLKSPAAATPPLCRWQPTRTPRR